MAVCNYCEQNEAHKVYSYAMGPLSSLCDIYLFREQSHPGRIMVAAREHIGDVMDLTDEQRNQFFSDMARAARAIKKVFNPDKINYAAYGDLVPHLHFHLVPKYRDQFEWGGTFVMNPQQKLLTDAECEVVAAKIRAAL